MARKGELVDSSALSASPEDRRPSKAKKEKSRVQSAWIETISKTRERYPIPSLHLRISLNDISRPWLGKWSQARRGGNDNNIPVVRTKSQAGMLRPTRLPTIYRSNARLFIDPFEESLITRNRSTLSGTDSEKHSVITDSPESVAVHIESVSPEKESVTIDTEDGIKITLSPRIEQVEHIPSRFEELSDDASVHELEAVYATASWTFNDRHHSHDVVLCEANDPTALTTLEILQRSFTVFTSKQPRPEISASLPRSKSLHLPLKRRMRDSTIVISPSMPLSGALYRSLTQLAQVPYSLITPLTSTNLPQSTRPYSSISVPLFMDASELAQLMHEVPPLPVTNETAADSLRSFTASRPSSEYHECHDPSTGSYAKTIYEREGTTSRSRSSSLLEGRDDDDENHAVADDDDDDDDARDGGSEADERNSTDSGRSRTQKPVSESINKPLPPEPQTNFSTILPALAPRPRLARMAQSHEILPSSRYSPTRVSGSDEIRRRATVKPSNLDQSLRELESRLSSIRRQLTVASGPCTAVSGKPTAGESLLMPPSSSRRSNGRSTKSRKVALRQQQPVARCVSASHATRRRRRAPREGKSRSCEDLQASIARLGNGESRTGKEAETWYRTASERSSVDLSHSVFSDTDTDGTCQTEQSQNQERVISKPESKEEDQPEEEAVVVEEPVIKQAELPQAMQSRNIGGDVAERIVLQIMSHSATLKDLFTFAALSRGFYRAYKQHELQLIKTVVHRSSTAAWELRETAETGPITPRSYLRLYSVELYTMGMLKSLILVQCESFLRPSTIAGLIGSDEDESAAIDAAFWRVWTFCRLFGRNAGQHEVIESQIDWLNGGPLARAQDPGTSFGVGNGDGLSKDEVYDMMEISNCLSVLMQGFNGRVDEARAAGIYDNCETKERRDLELLLEEWTFYIVTLGPSFILALARGSFATAVDVGLTEWTPPDLAKESGRSNFFKEALEQVYKSRQAAEPKTKGNRTKRSSKASSHRMTRSELARQIDRARQTAFAEEIRYQRQQSPGKSEPLTFSDERPMSVYSQIVKAMTSDPCHISAQDLANLPKPPSHLVASRTTSIMSGHTTPRRPPTPPIVISASAVPSADDEEFPINILEDDDNNDERPPSYTIRVTEVAQKEAPLVDPTDRALSHLVNVLGFGRDEAKWALTKSENGHGINMEQAIGLLVDGAPAQQTPTGSRASSRQEETQRQQYQQKQHPHNPKQQKAFHLQHQNQQQQQPQQQNRPASPVEIECSVARPSYIRQRSPIPNSRSSTQQEQEDINYDEMTPVEKERANQLRMREKSYRVLGIAPNSNPFGIKSVSAMAKRFSSKR